MQENERGMLSTTEPGELGLIDDRRILPERRIAPNDRRASPRQRILKIGRTYWPNGDSVECDVRNLSVSGAQLEVYGPIPNTFELLIDCDHYRRTCFVVWRNTNRIGVKFAKTTPPSRISRGEVSKKTEYRQYAAFCRKLALGSDVLSQEMLLKMATAWEAVAQRPRRNAHGW
jgi:hypothetical protein